MKPFDKGVAYYTKGKIEVGFPEDDVCCHWCPLLRVELKTDRWYCGKTGEYLLSPKFTIGVDCPITFNNEEQPFMEVENG